MSYVRVQNVLGTDEPTEQEWRRVPLTASNVMRDLQENVTVNWKGVAVAGAALGGLGLLYHFFYHQGGRERVNQYMRELALGS